MSRSNIYHVMLRGVNRQNIFEEDEDRLYFMSLLKDYKVITGFMLHAFVLMSNHIHLLIEPKDEPLDSVFRRIGTSYAMWYNRKYKRTGHLFQDRFRSEKVESDEYFITVLRYIIQNPMKAGLESRPGSYRWSSYFAYRQGKGAVTDIQYAAGFFNSRDELMEYLSRDNDDTALDEADCDRRLREEATKEKMKKITQCASSADFQQLASQQQKEYARAMYHAGMSSGQISRMTGMSKATVYRAVRVPEDQADGHAEAILRETVFPAYVSGTEVIW